MNDSWQELPPSGDTPPTPSEPPAAPTPPPPAPIPPDAFMGGESPYSEPPDPADLAAITKATGPGGNDSLPGCGLSAFIVLIVFVVLGWATVSHTGRLEEPHVESSPSAAVGPLPDVGVSVTTSTTTPTTTTTLAPALAPTGNGTGTGSQTPSQPASPAAQCGYPGSIGVVGGNPGSLGGTGGTTTVASTPFALTTPTLVNCGMHYKLSFTASGGGASASGHDCKMEGFDYDVSAYVQVGETVTVTLQLPPNDCG